MESMAYAYINEFAYAGILALLLLAVFGSPLPEDAVLLFSGAFASQGVIKVMPTLYIAYSGVLAGDILLYYIGRRYGRRLVLHKRLGRVVTRKRLRTAKSWFDRWGNSVVFFGRHLVGVRSQIFLSAGVLKFSFKRVLLFDSMSALLGVPLMVGIGYFLGKNLPRVIGRVTSVHLVISACVLAVAVSWLGYYIYKRKKALKGLSSKPV